MMSINSLATRTLVAATLCCATNWSLAATWVPTAGTNNWDVDTNWDPAGEPDAPGAAANFISTTPNTAANIAAVNGHFTVGSILFDLTGSTGNNDFRINSSGSSSLSLNNNGAGASITTQGTGTPNNDIAVVLVLDDDLVINVNQTTNQSSAGSLNITSNISGNGSLTKNGPGELTLATADKVYSGATILNEGRTRLSQAAALTSTSSFTINDGAQLAPISAGAYDLGPGVLNLNGNGLVGSFEGAIRPDTNLAVTVSNPVNLQSDTVLHVQGSTGGILTFSGNVSGVGALIQSGLNSNENLGRIVLNGANSYAGGTIVRGGSMEVSGASATFGAGDISVLDPGAVLTNPAGTAGAVAKLVIPTGVDNAIADTATLSIAGGFTGAMAPASYVELGDGINETVLKLVLNGNFMQPGTYGSTSSGATYTFDEFFAGTGIITVSVPEPATIWLCLAAVAFVGFRRGR